MKTLLLTLLLVPMIGFGQNIYGDNNGDQFGSSLSIGNSDGTIAVGAPLADDNGLSSGEVKVFQFNGISWTQRGSDIVGENIGDEFGSSVDMSDDGQTIVIGSIKTGNESGHLRVFKWNDFANDWAQLGSNINGENLGDFFGWSCSINSSGNIIAGGAVRNDGSYTDAGSVRVFELVSNNWVQIGQDIDGENSEDLSGHSVSLSSDGYTLSIGAGHNSDSGFEAGHVRVYNYDINSSLWIQMGLDIDGEATGIDHSGYSNSISSDGKTLAIGAQSNFNNLTLAAGQVRVYKYDGFNWIQVGSDIDGVMNSENAGNDVSISGDGSLLILGAIHNNTNGTYSGQARIYELNLGNWNLIGSPINGLGPDDYLGFDTDINRSGTITAAGAPFAVGPNGQSGMVRIYSVDNLLSSSEINSSSVRTLSKVIDVLGRETPLKTNTPLIFIYDDGTTERKMILDQ